MLKKGDIVKVVLPVATSGYDYIIAQDDIFEIGDFVRVPIRKSEDVGVIFEIVDGELGYSLDKVRAIISKVDEINLSLDDIIFINRVSDYNLTKRGNVLKMMMGIPKIFDVLTKIRKKHLSYDLLWNPIELNEEQGAAVKHLSQKLGAGFSVSLLDGITGSGKTEVYFSVVNEVLQNPEAQILIMLPEISLTGQFLSKFEARFGVKPTLWHSSVTPAQRRDNWHAIYSGKARVIVGTRSSLFLVYKNLNLIILDEEHDGSYKQEEGVIYHGRDMAVLKSFISKIPIILASATPSIESINNVNLGRYDVIKLKSRFGDAVIPDVMLVDMRQDKPLREIWGQSWMSKVLVDKVRDNLLNENQVMLYLNRRGYAPLVLCSDCGFRVKCPNCSVHLIAHNITDTRCNCHYCGFNLKLPKVCPECEKEGSFVLCGPGVERIEEEVKNRFPTARIITISSDSLTSQTKLNQIIKQIEDGEVDIIIGTQILVKGHHFPNLTLVGVVDGDMSFSGADLRANENTFQLLTQVAGRAGRASKKGEVLIQTFNPENLVMQAIKNNDRDSFVVQELKDRKIANMPPFSKLASVILSSNNKQILDGFCMALARKIPNRSNGISVFGPIDAPLALIKKSYRKRFLLIVDKNLKIQDIIKLWLGGVVVPNIIKIKIDIDPYNFM